MKSNVSMMTIVTIIFISLTTKMKINDNHDDNNDDDNNNRTNNNN